MDRYRVFNSSLKGTIEVPSSKSHTLRAILFASLADGKSFIQKFLPSSDAHAMIQACRLLGADIKVGNQTLEIQGIKGKIQSIEDVIHAGNSGIVFRFMTALASVFPHTCIVTGDYSIRHQRPILPLLKSIRELGGFAVSSREDGFAPVIVKGPWKNYRATVSGHDSQPVSALLIASVFHHAPLELSVTNPGEKPWVLLTLDWFDRLGIPYENHNFLKYKVTPTRYRGFEFTVPGDLSSAAFPLAAALVTQSELKLTNIDLHDIQGDKELIFTLKKMGAKIEIDDKEKTLSVFSGSQLKGIEIDVNAFIDSIAILAVIACYAEGETRIVNGAVAREKESDRIHAIATELKKMGGQIHEQPDGLIIQGSPLKGAHLFSYHDHRVAMSLAVAAMGALGETTIESVECVMKTYPDFKQEFQKIGSQIAFERI